MHTPVKVVQEDSGPRLNQVEGLAKLIAERALLDALLSRVPHFPKVSKK